MMELTHSEKLAIGYLSRAGSFSFHELPKCYVRGGHGLVRKGIAEKRTNDLFGKFPGIFSKWEFRATDEGAAIGFQVS